MSDHIRIVVERFWMENGRACDVTAVKSDMYRPTQLTGYSDEQMAALVWSMIARSAFEADEEKAEVEAE